MNQLRGGVLGLTAGLFLMAPQEADAQSEDGWWEWALREAVELRSDLPERDRGEARGDGRTLADIIFGRDDRDRRDRRDRRDGREDDREHEDEDWWEDEREEREDRAERGDRAERRGPPFCRNGRGHPVHGRQWCREKGFGLGGSSIRWEDRGWEDIILGPPRGGERGRSRVDRGGLIDVLGDVVFGRLDDQRRRLGGRGPLEGRWLELRDGARVLQVRSGGVPVAELSDVDGDGRVDVALVPRR